MTLALFTPRNELERVILAARQDTVTIDALLMALAEADLFVAGKHEATPNGRLFRPLVIQYEGVPFTMTFTAPNRPEPGAALARYYEDVLKVKGPDFFLHLAPQYGVMVNPDYDAQLMIEPHAVSDLKQMLKSNEDPK